MFHDSELNHKISIVNDTLKGFIYIKNGVPQTTLHVKAIIMVAILQKQMRMIDIDTRAHYDIITKPSDAGASNTTPRHPDK